MMPLPFFRLTSLQVCVAVRRYSSFTLRLGGAFEFCGLPPSSFVANSENCSSHQLTHVLQGGIAAIPSCPLFRTLIFLFLQMLAAST
jgi:hypothetical protein